MSYILSGPVVKQISHLQFKTTAESGLVELRNVEIHKAVATKRKEKVLKNIAKYNWTEKYVVEAKASIYLKTRDSYACYYFEINIKSKTSSLISSQKGIVDIRNGEKREVPVTLKSPNLTPSKIKFEQELNTIPENFPEVPDFLQIKNEVESFFDYGAAKIPTNDVDKDLYNIILCYNIRKFSKFLFCIIDSKLDAEMKICEKSKSYVDGRF